ncbi:MAG: hypothetical protein M0003_11240 [Acidithiobacillus sp.]|nr:hypothetical protein [Acidithiobacillus sp.]
MDMERISRLVDASHTLNNTLTSALREIDRMALNALVLVKRQGNALAGYGVIAQAFRERAAFLKEVAQDLQHYMNPLIQTQMRILTYTWMAESFAHLQRQMGESRCANLACAQKHWQKNIVAREAEAHGLFQSLLKAVVRVQDGIAEQEYVVVNGRIEAALSEGAGVPLGRVSNDMGVAVGKVSQAVSHYRRQLEESFHENSIGI